MMWEEKLWAVSIWGLIIISKNSLFIVLFLSVLLLNGCGVTKPEANFIRKKEPAPSWIVKPDVEGYVTAVGSAPEQSSQKRAALIKAKANIAKKIEIYVDTELLIRKKCSGSQCEDNLHSLSALHAKQMIGRVEILKQWKDPEAGNLYLLIGVKK